MSDSSAGDSGYGDPSRPRLFLTGSTGLLGGNLILTAVDRCDVFATSRTTRLIAPRVRWAPCDLLDRETLFRLVEEHPEAAHALNVQGTANAIAAARRASCRIVYVSTDSVFDGERAPYAEADCPRPLNVYARSKLEAESLVLAADSRHAVVRTNLFGWNCRGKAGLAEWIFDLLSRGQPVPGFVDCFFSPLNAATLALILLRLAQDGNGGLLHAGAAAGVSKFAFARMIARQWGYDERCVIPVHLGQHPFRARRPLDTTLDSRVLAGRLRMPMPSIPDEIALLHRQSSDGFRQRLASLCAHE